MHVNPVVEHIRFYPDGSCYTDKDPYETILTVTWLNDDEIYVQGLLGKFSKERFDTIINFYKARGVKRIRYERDGKQLVI